MEETKSNKPKDNPLYQQRLRAWKPLLTFKDAAIYFIVTGVIVVAIGVGIFIPDQNVQEHVVDYTDCTNSTGGKCSSIDNFANNINCLCSLPLRINKHIPAPVYFYYGMDGFYQNHRQLVKSSSMSQLMGDASPSIESCSPVIRFNSTAVYAPCGQMANVMFNDSFVLVSDSDNVNVPWTTTNISLESDRKRYGTPSSWAGTVKPPNWAEPVDAVYKNAYLGHEPLMVWMRPAPLPRFRKLWRISVATSRFPDGLGPGNYTLNINYTFPVRMFGGFKYFIVTNLSWVGGKNQALPILYLVTGLVEIVIGIVLVVLHCKRPPQRTHQNSFAMTSEL